MKKAEGDVSGHCWLAFFDLWSDACSIFRASSDQPECTDIKRGREPKMAGEMQGKVIVVTGAASGIGLATAALLVAQGATTIMTDKQADLGASEARKLGPRASFFDHDVTDEARWVSIIDHVTATHGRLDGLVNNAGIGSMFDIERETLESWRRVQAVNVEGVFLGCKYAVRSMKATGGGSIVNVSSVAGLIGAAELPAYCASKGAVRLLSKSVALWCAQNQYNIRCNSLHPSFLETPLVQQMIDLAPDSDKMLRHLERTSALGRLGKPDDAAQMIVFLLSDKSPFITGAEFVVDGGTTAR
jgi:3(or 17)beta-hydroxysteroid dehydrogenase